jgi:hypothetical protein
MYSNKIQQTNKFSGLVTLTDINGNILKALTGLELKVINSVIIVQNLILIVIEIYVDMISKTLFVYVICNILMK